MIVTNEDPPNGGGGGRRWSLLVKIEGDSLNAQSDNLSDNLFSLRQIAVAGPQTMSRFRP